VGELVQHVLVGGQWRRLGGWVLGVLVPAAEGDSRFGALDPFESGRLPGAERSALEPEALRRRWTELGTVALVDVAQVPLGHHVEADRPADTGPEPWRQPEGPDRLVAPVSPPIACHSAIGRLEEVADVVEQGSDHEL
jgi:hypothetical protein